MKNNTRFISINGTFTPAEDACISVQDRGLRFGDGVFETIRIFKRIPYQWETHIKRLKEGLESLKINASLSNLLSDALTLIAKNQVEDGTLRLMITRGAGSIGYLPLAECQPTIILEAIGKKFPAMDAGKLYISQYTKPDAHTLPANIKHMQGLNSVLAKMEAHANGCDEALLLSHEKAICEASSGNIFWVKDGKICTPSLTCPMVNGTMRSAIIRLWQEEITEGIWSMDAIKDADEVFLSNASWPIMPIHSIEPLGVHYHSHHVANRLATIIKEDMQHYVDDWQPPVA